MLVGIIESALAHIQDIIVVEDGWTPGTRPEWAPFLPRGVQVLSHDQRRGKGAALMTGFRRAVELGFTHAITMDADGQYFAGDLPAFLAAVHTAPDALILGCRDPHRAPFGRRLLQAHYNLWTWIETSEWAGDAQSGFRAYPLKHLFALVLRAHGHDFEIETLVKLAWSGTPILKIPVQACYSTKPVSRFRLRDAALVAHMNAKLVMQRILAPPALRATMHRVMAEDAPAPIRGIQFIRAMVREGSAAPGHFALSVGLGIMMGILPIWGFQTAAAVMSAHLLGLRKTVALVASNISIPVCIPFILYASLLTGRLLLTGRIDYSLAPKAMNLATVWDYTQEYVTGAIVLSIGAGMTATLAAYVLARALHREGG